MIEHKDISVGEIHSPFQWEVLNVAELSTIVPEGVNDVRKVAFVVDDGTGNPTAYVLTQFTPAIEWKPLVNVVGGGGSVIWGGIGGTVANQTDLVAYLQANFYTQAQINSFMNGYYTTSEIDVIASGKADLVGGLVPASQLPSYVDDVLEYANLAALPITGEAGKIYITLDTNRQYRWGGSSYIDITGFVDNVNGKTGAVVVTKEDVGLTNVDNTSDANKPISTATQTALNGKSSISHLHDDRYYTESEVDTLLSAKQNTITVDAAPTNGSTNPVQSNGVFDALALKSDTTHNHTGIYEPADATIVKDADIGVTVQPYNANIQSHISSTSNPHSVTAAQVGAYTTAQTDTLLNGKIDESREGIANGIATLDTNAKINLSQIPDSILGQLEYQGVWDMTTLPTPTQKGHYWIASVAGNGYEVGDWAVYNGSTFDKVDNTDAVSSVAGRTGNIVLNKNDVGLSNVDNTSDLDKPVSTATQTALDLKAEVDDTTPTTTKVFSSDKTMELHNAQAQAIANKVDKIGANDIEVTDATKGVILKSANGTRFRITIADDGSLTTTAV